jgi:hypothetical protein
MRYGTRHVNDTSVITLRGKEEHDTSRNNRIGRVAKETG